MGKNPKFYIGQLIKIKRSNTFMISFLLLFFFAGFTTVNAVNKISRTKINLQLENVSIKSILSLIEKQTDYIFIYNEGIINSTLKKSISIKDGNIETVLNLLFKDMNIDLKIDGRQVYILKKAILIEEQSKPQKKII